MCHVSALRILVVDGNIAATRARQTAVLGYDSGTGYANTLRRIDPSLHVDILLAADGGSQLPAGIGLESYHGVAITGSALNIQDGGDPVTRQVALAKAVFAAGVPFFGSCWGLQVAATAAGGTVRINPRGREFGFARRILLTDAGHAHPLFAGKPRTFEAPTIHRDEIASLPANAQILATNEFGIQAAEFAYDRGSFWGVQYHPEYDYVDIAAAAERYAPNLITEGLFHDAAAVTSYAGELRALHTGRDNAALLWKHGLGAAVRNEKLRLIEISNWLETRVLSRVRQPGLDRGAPR
jgi:GMP synthase (glutamine-hydrolysing)